VSQQLNPGDPAPAFQLPISKGGTKSLADYAGKALVLFFYPKDDTDACTREAVAFSEMQAKFGRKGAALLGVSRDSMADHKAFAKKHALKVALGSDEDATVCNAYGVWAEKQLYGRKFMGIVRSTFLIDADGMIRRVWRNVRVPGHAEAVFTELASDV
jgi:thioredoxin-dependent peroxiredoxin